MCSVLLLLSQGSFPSSLERQNSRFSGLWPLHLHQWPQRALESPISDWDYAIGFPDAEALGFTLNHTTDTSGLLACRQSIMGPLCFHDTSPLVDPLGFILSGLL